MQAGRIDTWIFDLDNTLYPASCNLFVQIDQRIGAFVAELLGVDAVAARRLQKDWFHAHGATLRGLMLDHGVDPAAYLEYVHAIDHSPVQANPALDLVLERLPGRKLVFTNGSTRHAERVMDRLGIARHFEGIFDVAAAGYVPKPHPDTYRRMIARHNVVPAGAAFFEDQARNLLPAAALGMTTVWIRSAGPGADAIASLGAEGEHVHHVCEDLVAWLESAVAEAIAEAVAKDRPPA